MNNLEAKHRIMINKLYETYGSLLTKKQQTIFEEYYQSDLSLQEIAEILNISRAAVLDSLQKSVFKLEETEQKIKHLEFRNNIEDILNSDLKDEEKIKKIMEII